MSEAQYKPERRFTYADYLTWPDEERWELIEGVAYDMTPAPGVDHQTLVLKLGSQLVMWLAGKPGRALISPLDVRLPEPGQTDEQTETVVQPDVMVVCDPAKIDKRGVRGAPDLVIEILSPSTAAKDEIRKKALYERHGVREYWIVRPADRIVEINVLGDNQRYSPPRFLEAKGRAALSVLEGFEFDLDQAFAQVAAE